MGNQTNKLDSVIKYLQIGLFILLIAIVIKSLKEIKGNIIKENPYTYKTDSLINKTSYQLKPVFNISTPPITYTTYPINNNYPKIDSVKYIPGELILYIEKLKDSLRIKEAFLTRYPKNSKLLEINLSKDSLDITLQNIDDIITTSKYPIYLDNFKYQWYDNKLHNSKFKQSNSNNLLNRYNNLYVNTGYMFIDSNPNVGLEYNLNLGRFKIDADILTTLERNPQLYINTKVGYRLFK